MVFCVEVLSGLWIGTTKLMKSDFSKKKKINLLIKSNVDLDFIGNYQKYADHIKPEIEKFERQKCHHYLMETTELISLKIDQGYNVLITDDTGVSYSSLIVLAYLIRYGQMNIQQAVKVWNSKISYGVKMTSECQRSLQVFFNHVGGHI